jgi:hypothetical protein
MHRAERIFATVLGDSVSSAWGPSLQLAHVWNGCGAVVERLVLSQRAPMARATRSAILQRCLSAQLRTQAKTESLPLVCKKGGDGGADGRAGQLGGDAGGGEAGGGGVKVCRGTGDARPLRTFTVLWTGVRSRAQQLRNSASAIGSPRCGASARL